MEFDLLGGRIQKENEQENSIASNHSPYFLRWRKPFEFPVVISNSPFLTAITAADFGTIMVKTDSVRMNKF